MPSTSPIDTDQLRLFLHWKDAKALWIFISIYPLLKNECLSVDTKLTLYKALIRSILTYACPAWEFVADSYLLKLQHLWNKVLCTIGNLPQCTLTCDLHMVFKIPYLDNFITKLCRQKATVVLNHENVSIHSIGQDEAWHGKYKRFKLGGSQAYDWLII